MDIEEKIIAINSLRINYPALVEVSKMLNVCHLWSKKQLEPKCMLITGPPGIGKTTLYQKYAENYPRIETDEGTIVPVLTSVIPVPATVKSLVTSLLESLGDPIPDRGSIANQTIRLRQLLASCGTEIIILDEFQHFIDRDSDRVLQTTSDWLKNLINQTRIPIVLLGMSYSVKILDANPQLRRRFTMRYEMKPFNWKEKDSNGSTIYPIRTLLRVLEKNLPLKDASNLSDPEIAYRIYNASAGIIDSIMKLVRGAAWIAINSNEEKISLEMLSRVYQNELSSNYPNYPNPFLVKKIEQLITA